MAPYEIRLLTAADASVYWHFRLEALETEPEAFSTSAEEHRATTVADAARLLSSEPADEFIVGAFGGGRLVGTVRYRRERGSKLCHKAWVLGVYVTPSARRAGVARDLLRTLMDHAAAISGIEQLVLAVATNRLPAATLYRSLGFQPFGIERNALKIGDRYVDEEFMVWFTCSV